MSEHTPSQAALTAAVELEIEGCIGILTTQGLALKIDAAAAASNEARIDALTKALEVLLEEAENFGVSGVYFNEECMGHKGPALARAALSLGSDKFMEDYKRDTMNDLVSQNDVLRKALAAMVDRWEPDCSGTDRVMWENARAALSSHTEQEGGGVTDTRNERGVEAS